MRNINFLIKPASSLCNMRCRYCFYEDEACNRSQKSMGIMQNTTVDTLLSEAFAAVEPGGCISFAFQGGEPTAAGLPYFRYFTDQVRALRPPRVEIRYAIQTNGLALDESWVRLFRENDFLVGLSLDGTKEIHNAHRIDAGGRDTWNRIVHNLTLLQKHQVAVNALCVVTAACARSPEKVYTSLKKLGLHYLQFIPCMDPLGKPRGSQPFSLTPDAYSRFLCRLFDLWYEDWLAGHYCSIRLFDDYIHLILGDQPGTCSTCGQCGSYFVVEGDGSVYPCDFYVLDDWKLGQLGKDSLPQLQDNARRREFLAWGLEKPQACRNCRWRSLCNGGCKHDWLYSGNQPQNYFCPAFTRLFAHAEQRLLEIARAERAALARTEV